jgi:hypothetical protein
VSKGGEQSLRQRAHSCALAVEADRIEVAHQVSIDDDDNDARRRPRPPLYLEVTTKGFGQPFTLLRLSVGRIVFEQNSFVIGGDGAQLFDQLLTAGFAGG